MHKTLVVTISGVTALAIYATIEQSVVMFVSAAAIGVIYYVFRHARMRDRVIAIVAAALGGAIAAEIAHTIYYHTNVAEPVPDSGGLFLTAILLGLINAAVAVILVALAEAWSKYGNRKSE